MIVQLKDNQPTLCRSVELVCKKSKPLSGVQTIDRNKRNRHETRTVAVFDARRAVARTEWQPYVAAIIAVERTVLTFQPATGLWKSSFESSFYLSNRPVLAGTAAAAIREHWGIENNLHWHLDITFGEDANRVQRRHGAENLGLVRRLAVALLKRHASKMSMKCKRLAAACNTDFLEEILQTGCNLGKP